MTGQVKAMQGKIMKGIAGFYYVYAMEEGRTAGNIYECKAKGIFRKDHKKPLVGDDVDIVLLDRENRIGNIEKILPRRNELIRPAVANIDQALVIFAVTRPEPNLNLLDRFLLMMGRQQKPCMICFNKTDLSSKEEADNLSAVYKKSGCRVLFVSVKEKRGMEELISVLEGKTTAVAGPSGVGKSSIINELQSEIKMDTGEISEKIARGKHTTRHSELIAIGRDTFIMDTPGFSSLGMFDLEKDELKEYYPEFKPFEDKCRFQGCVHINEPDCEVKRAVESGGIHKKRYENYKALFGELKDKRKY